MIEPTEADIGRSVIYTGNRYPGGKIEEGVITSFNDHAIFVRYGHDKGSKATNRQDLEWVSPYRAEIAKFRTPPPPSQSQLDKWQRKSGATGCFAGWDVNDGSFHCHDCEANNPAYCIYGDWEPRTVRSAAMANAPNFANLASLAEQEATRRDMPAHTETILKRCALALREQADEAKQLRTALKAVRRWVETLPNAAGIPGFPLDDVDAALMEPKP